MYANVKGLNLYYERRGAGRPMLLLHGGLMSSGSFAPILPQLSDHHEVITPSHYVEVFKLLDGGLRDGGWMGEGRPKGGHALAILPGLTHYNMSQSPLVAATILDLLDAPGVA